MPQQQDNHNNQETWTDYTPPVQNQGEVWTDYAPGQKQDLTKRPSWWDRLKSAWSIPQDRDPKTGLPITPGPSADDLSKQAEQERQQNLRNAAQGKPTSDLEPAYLQTVADARKIGESLFSPKGAALGLAMTNPVTGIPASAYMMYEGEEGVRKNLPETLEGKPDAVQKSLLGAAEFTGGAAGLRGQGLAAKEMAMDNPDVAALKAQGVAPNSRGAAKALADARTARPYMNSPKTQAEAQTSVARGGPVRSEIWDQYMSAVNQIGTRPVQGPLGNTTVAELESLRSQLSAQNARIKAGDADAIAEVRQAGRSPAQNLQLETDVQNALDPELQSTGLDPKLARKTMGGVIGVSKRIAGRQGGIEKVPSGLGRVIRGARVGGGVGGSGELKSHGGFIAENVGNLVEAGKDIAAGRGLWSKSPADVATREGFRNPGAKPNLSPFTPAPMTLPPQMGPGIGPAPQGPGPSPAIGSPYMAPAPPQQPTQLPNSIPGQAPVPPGPGSNVALFPDIPSGQAPSPTLGAGEVPNWPPKVPDWSPANTAPPIPDAAATPGSMSPGGVYRPPGGAYPIKRGVTSPSGGPAHPAPDKGGASVVAPNTPPPTDLSAAPKSQPEATVLPEQVNMGKKDFVDESVHPWSNGPRVDKAVQDIASGEKQPVVVARPNADGSVSPVKGHQTPIAATRLGQDVQVVNTGPITDAEKAAMTAESHFFPQEDRGVPADLGKDAESERASLPEEVQTIPAEPAHQGPVTEAVQRGNALPEFLGQERRDLSQAGQQARASWGMPSQTPGEELAASIRSAGNSPARFSEGEVRAAIAKSPDYSRFRELDARANAGDRIAAKARDQMIVDAANRMKAQGVQQGALPETFNF